MYLHGHTHQIESHFGSYALLTVGFGSAYPSHLERQAPPFTSTFAVCELDEELHIRFVSWEPNYGVWRPAPGVPGDFSEPSDILPDAYRVPVPSTKSSVVRSRTFESIETPLHLDSPIWVDDDYVDNWVKLLELVGRVENDHQIVRQISKPEVGGQVSLIIADQHGKHGVRAFAAETAVITYEHVEAVNTELDSLQLDSYTIVTLGHVSANASVLANTLRRTKNITVLDGGSLARELASTAAIKALFQSHSSTQPEVSPRPLITPDGLTFLLLGSPAGTRYAIIDLQGQTLPEHGSLVQSVRSRFPELGSLQYGLRSSAYPRTDQRRQFDRDAYLRRCLSTYDTANYAGLAAVGLRFQVESLRRIYVPTAATVETDQAAMEATHRAIDDLVEALGLDEVQKTQLARQMKSTYGVRSTSEADAASGLYQTLSNVVVLGDPGSGKSCFVRTQMMAYCEQSTNGDHDWYSEHVPVFLPLAEYSDALGSDKPLLQQCVAHAISQQLELDLQTLEVLLSRGKVALFLDGLDEITSISTREFVVTQLGRLLATYAPLGNRFVLTSRPAAVRDMNLPSGLASLSLQGLSD